MANFPPSQQHPFTLGIRLSVFSFIVEFAPIIIAGIKLAYLVAGYGTGVGVSLTQLLRARRNFATHLRGNLTFLSV